MGGVWPIRPGDVAKPNEAVEPETAEVSYGNEAIRQGKQVEQEPLQADSQREAPGICPPSGETDLWWVTLRRTAFKLTNSRASFRTCMQAATSSGPSN